MGAARLMGIRVQATGLKEFRRALRAADAQLPRELRKALNAVGQAIVNEAVPKMPKKSGKLRASVRARSTQTEGRVIVGKANVQYAGFIEFGGSVGRNRSVKRTFVKQGRYLYPAYQRRLPEVRRLTEQVVNELAQRIERG